VFTQILETLKARKIEAHKKLSAGSVESGSDLIKQFELALRVLANPLDRLHVGLLAKEWKLTISMDDVYAGHDPRNLTGMDVLGNLLGRVTSDEAGAIREAVRSLEWSPADFKLTPGLDRLKRFAEGLGDSARLGIEQDIKEWGQHWDYHLRTEAGGTHSVGAFLSQVALGTTQQPQQPGVALLTVHSAKGMEFDVVFVIGLSEDTFPDYRARSDAEMAEERRNAFVAVTRSRRLLYLSYPKQKMMPWGGTRGQAPSRFLRIVSEAVTSK
jgi:DNA helicase II / ATP-dependent DNA helicase PcrA